MYALHKDVIVSIKILIIKLRRYLPIKVLKFKFSFFTIALMNFKDELTAYNDKNINISISIILNGNTYKNAPKMPLNLYFNMIDEILRPVAKPL